VILGFIAGLVAGFVLGWSSVMAIWRRDVIREAWHVVTVRRDRRDDGN